MDIKFSLVQLLLSFTILTLGVGPTSAGPRSRGTGRVPFRRHNRREVRDYLAPPSQDASYATYGGPVLQPPPLIPYRPGRLINSPPPTEAPSYFSRLASWLNPFGGSPTPPPISEIHVTRFGQSHAPPHAYGPPGSPPPRSYGPPVPQPPPAGPNGYLPPKGKDKNCNPCDKVPWVPMAGVIQKDAYGSSATNVEIQPSVNQEVKNLGEGGSSAFAEGIRTPDFSYGLPPDFSFHGNPHPGPIPYPQLYPGPMPPLFKSEPFNRLPENFHPTPSIQLDSGPPDHVGDSLLSNGHVEVLPPGAEVDTSGDVGVIGDPLPPGYGTDHSLHFGTVDSHHGTGYESTSLNVQQSTTIHEDHLSTQLTAGYKVQSPTAPSVEVIESVPAGEYSSTVNHQVHYEQSPIIDLSKENQRGPEEGDKEYAADLNPPPNISPQSYEISTNIGGSATKEAGGQVLKNSYGTPVNPESPKDSLVASTISNGTFSTPTPSYGIPDVGELPITHEAAKPTAYESFPPSTEKFLISVTDPGENSKGPLNSSSQEQRDEHEQQVADHQNYGKILDSYQRQIEQTSSLFNHQHGESEYLEIPKPLVPYRPSSLYVPYPPYSGPGLHQNGLSSPIPAGSTTEEPFLEALLKSYDNFKKESQAKEQQARLRIQSQENEGHQHSGQPGGTTWVSQPQPSFSSPEGINPSVYISGGMMPPPVSSAETNQQQSEGKKNKQVQIIIPYTSQYTPSPFQSVIDDWSGRGPLAQTQARRVPPPEQRDQNYVGQESNKVEITRPLKPLQNLLFKEVAEKPTLKQTNNSIDVLRLQKNIDNWTIQEYSRGITSSTALPSASHPYLLPSKKIPHEYLSNNQSSVSEERIDTHRPDLPGFNYNELEHEGAASSRVDVPHIQVLTVEGVSKSVDYKPKSVEATIPSSSSSSSSSSFISTSTTTTTTTTTTTPASWAELPVSISPHNNERVYVVTPQPVRSPKSWPEFGDTDKSGKYEAIERAYQVLPQAVNNLASPSVSGPEHSPLWGIMEHDQYARNDQENSTTSVPILYSGHSKVSNTGSH